MKNFTRKKNKNTANKISPEQQPKPLHSSLPIKLALLKPTLVPVQLCMLTGIPIHAKCGIH